MSDYKPTRPQRRCRHVWIETGRDTITQAVYKTCWKCKLVDKSGGIFEWVGSDLLSTVGTSIMNIAPGPQTAPEDSNVYVPVTEDDTPSQSAERSEE